MIEIVDTLVEIVDTLDSAWVWTVFHKINFHENWLLSKYWCWCKEGKFQIALETDESILCSFSFFNFLEINEKSSNRRRQERCKDVCVAAEQADEANEKDANDFKKVEEVIVKPDFLWYWKTDLGTFYQKILDADEAIDSLDAAEQWKI